MKAPLILVVSDRMDSNKKNNRNENGLIRLGVKARRNLGLTGEKVVEVWPDTDTSGRINRSKSLEIFQAYSSDLKKAKESMSNDDFERVGFVTSTIFSYVCKDGRKNKENIWLADTVEDTVVGGDPEFMLFDKNGNIMYASKVNNLGHNAELGSDGPLAELRPKPTIEVEDFVNNIQDILTNHPNTKLIDPYEWVGGCHHHGYETGASTEAIRDWSVGGHIHLGTPGNLAQKISSFGSNYSQAVYACLQRILDDYVAVPMMKLDGKKNGMKRREHYGYFGDHKTDHSRLEYRTLSGEWLTHPELARIVIGTVKAIAHAYFRALEDGGFKHSLIMTKKHQEINEWYSHQGLVFFHEAFDSWKNIEITRAFNTISSSGDMRAILHKWEKEFRKSYFDELKAKYRSLQTYREYADYIDKFIEVVKLPQNVLNEREKGLKHTWVGNSNFII